MHVILLERVAKLGQMGDIVSVKQGFARNFLLPQGKALRATEANKAAFESQKVTLEAKNLETKTEAEAISAKLGGQQFIIIRSASDAASAEGFKIDKKQVILQAPIKELGLHKVGVSLHPEVECSIELNVARSSEEAELQASGQSIQDLAAAAEAEAEFEIAELFDDMGSAAALDEDGNELIKDEPKAESEEKVEE